MEKNVKSYGNVVFSVVAKSFSIIGMVILVCQISFADTQGEKAKADEPVMAARDSGTAMPGRYSNEEIDDMIKSVLGSIPAIPDRYTNKEVDDKITAVKKSIPATPDRYTNEEIDAKLKAIMNSIPATPDVYSKEEVDKKIMALNKTILALKTALGNLRNSIPEELKWPVKTKKIFIDIRNSIPEDITE